MKTITKSKILFLFILISGTQGCTAQEEPKTVSNEYQACCGSKSVERTIGKGNTYVPNVFTPNADGINDFFRPFVSEGLEAQAFTIYSAVGDSILYSRAYFNNTDTTINLGWNGLRKDGTPYTGLFKYGVAIYANGIREEITGEACCVRCDPSATILKTKSGCFYPVQAGLKGNLEVSKSNAEKDCF